MNFYLAPANAAHVDALHALAAQPPSAQTDAQLLAYALEGVRLAGSAPVHFRAAAADAIPAADGTEVLVQPGDLVTVVPVSHHPPVVV